MKANDRRLLLAVLAACIGINSAPFEACAALVVNPPRPIQHQVEVQLIQTAHDNGSQPATIFGNATQRASIESAVDEIWGQAGIDIQFLPDIVRFNNTYAFEGYGTYRPNSHLASILGKAAMEGDILHPDPQVINMFFVEIVPGFDLVAENTVNGIATLGGNGIALFVGENLLTIPRGRELVASVVAHEIGHNLGLKHTLPALANLMSPNATSEQLSDSQIDAVFETEWRNDAIATIPPGGTGFVQELGSATIGADFNGDGLINGQDLNVWKNAFGSSPAGDADGDRDTDGTDFLIWQRQFHGSALVSASTAADSATVPEPSTLLGVLVLAIMAGPRWSGVRSRTATG